MSKYILEVCVDSVNQQFPHIMEEQQVSYAQILL